MFEVLVLDPIGKNVVILMLQQFIMWIEVEQSSGSIMNFCQPCLLNLSVNEYNIFYFCFNALLLCHCILNVVGCTLGLKRLSYFHCFQLYFKFMMQYGSHSKKRPNNLILARTYDHHIYDLVEVGVENYKSMESYVYDKKLAPLLGSKPFFAFIGEHFESAEELKHLKEVLLDLFRGEVRHFETIGW